MENWECRSGYEIGEQSLECGDVVGVGETLDSQWEITVANRRPFSLLSPISYLPPLSLSTVYWPIRFHNLT